MGKNELRHGAHTTWRCQYHLVFAPKFRRKAIYGELRADIGKILRKLCEGKRKSKLLKQKIALTMCICW